MPPKIARFAALGALAACGGMAALYALFLYITKPAPTSGLDPTLRFLSWFTVAGVILALIGVHLVFGRQLFFPGEGRSAAPLARVRAGARIPGRRTFGRSVPWLRQRPSA
jgi:hypothetical protein